MLRLVTALARTAAGYGADVLTHVRARVAPGRTDGFKTVTLTLNDRTREVSAAGVVNATGVWAGDIESDVTVTPSRGTHIVVDAEKVGNSTGALTMAVPGSINRFCFILPNQLGRCYIGLTDEKAQLADVPEAPESDVQWILDVVNQGLETTLTTDDVLGAFAGLCPLAQLRSASDVGSTADLSREHLILNNDGVVTVTGGKLTEYRLMAEQTIDELLDDDSVRTHLSQPGAMLDEEHRPRRRLPRTLAAQLRQHRHGKRSNDYAAPLAGRTLRRRGVQRARRLRPRQRHGAHRGS